MSAKSPIPQGTAVTVQLPSPLLLALNPLRFVPVPPQMPPKQPLPPRISNLSVPTLMLGMSTVQ